MTPNPLNVKPHDIPRILWYRKKTFLALVMLITVASAVTAYFLPNVYEATSTILLDQKPISQSFVTPTSISPDIERRLRVLRTVLMSEYLLRKVIVHLKLVPNMYDPLAIQGKIDELREGIKVRVRGTDSLQISYQGYDNQMVMRITNELANFFTEDTLRYMQTVMKGTNAFLEQELAATEEELKAQEAKMLGFKGSHLQELPGQVAANQATLDRLLGRLDGIDRSVRDLKGMHALTQKELAEFEASFQPAHPLRKHLLELEAKLEVYKTRYTAEHPYMDILIREIEELRPQVEGQASAGTRCYNIRPTAS
jgi:uncharacterized protein involved in exopolysaccharide biosynthesis